MRIEGDGARSFANAEFNSETAANDKGRNAGPCAARAKFAATPRKGAGTDVLGAHHRLDSLALPIATTLTTARHPMAEKVAGRMKVEMEPKSSTGGTARKFEVESKKVIMELPSDLHQQIADTAEAMNLGFDETVTVLLRYGIEVKGQRESKIEELVEALRSGKHHSNKEQLADKLGGEIFGR